MPFMYNLLVGFNKMMLYNRVILYNKVSLVVLLCLFHFTKNKEVTNVQQKHIKTTNYTVGPNFFALIFPLK